jgi:hypothetical protein
MDFMTSTWDPGDKDMDLTAVAGALSSLQTSLKTWDKEVFGSIKQQVKKLREDLEVERARSLYRGPSSAEKSIMDRLAIILSREETMEKQRARISWLREGDRNTAFFQAKARARGRTNRIRMLTDPSGRVVTE